MNFLSFYYTHKPGGFCKRLYRLLGALADKGHTVTYLCLDPPPEHFPSNVDIQVLPFPVKRRRGALFWGIFFLLIPLLLIPQVLRNRPDRYVLFSPVYSALFLLARLVHSRPLILFFRSLPFRINRITKQPAWVLFFSDLIDRLGVTNATTIVCMTKAMKSELEAFLGKRLPSTHILPNEVTIQNLTRAPRSTPPFTFLTSGVLDHRKNISFLLQALEDIDPLSYSLLIAGDGPLRASLEMDTKQKGLQNITFLGWQTNLSQLYSQVDLVIHPALHEGVPNSVLEPLGHGLGVLCSDIPELSELIKHKDLLFSLDDTQTLTNQLSLFTSNNDVRKKILLASQEVAQRLAFDWDTRATDICLSQAA